MIHGQVTAEGDPVIEISLGNKQWTAVIDSSFNGDLELPESLRSDVQAIFYYQGKSFLASGQSVLEDLYLVRFPFDGKILEAIASFSSGQEILIGTHLMRRHRLEINFPARTVLLQRVA